MTKDPVFCRECGVLAALSWKLYRPVFIQVSHSLATTLPVFCRMYSEEFEVGWCGEHYMPMPSAEEIVRVLGERGVACYREEMPALEEVK